MVIQQLVLLCLCGRSYSAPVEASNFTPQSTELVGYVSEPNVRGTTSLVLSCLLTLILCVWSALHLNVPQEHASRLDILLCNLRWIITGVYAPELVVFTAWRQWASARLLGSLIKKLSKQMKERDPVVEPVQQSLTTRTTTSFTRKTLYDSTSLSGHRHKWTKTHDFFASTGGFAFEIYPDNSESSDGSTVFLPKTCPTRLTLTARGIALLAKCNRLPDIPESDILDKSKANDLAKALVVIQASWMLLQTVARLISKLPVSLLEVNTIAHVACVFVMYILWWNKPLLPNEPLILGGDWVEPLCAFMYMSSELSGESEKNEAQTVIKSLFASLNWYSKIPEIDLIALRRPKATAEEQATNTDRPRLPSFHSASSSATCVVELQAKQLEKAADTAFFERRPRVKGKDLKDAPVSEVTRRRWELAFQAINEYPVILDDQTLFTHEDGTCTHFKPEELLVRRVQNWPSNDLLRNVNGLMVGMVLWMASFAYGAIHAAAWNDVFPSIAEKWLWRSSATYIGFCGGLWIILNYVAQAYKPLNEFWENWMDGQRGWASNVIIGFLVLVCGALFALARLFIVVEAVISIRALPANSYVTPEWTKLFPHL